MVSDTIDPRDARREHEEALALRRGYRQLGKAVGGSGFVRDFVSAQASGTADGATGGAVVYVGHPTGRTPGRSYFCYPRVG